MCRDVRLLFFFWSTTTSLILNSFAVNTHSHVFPITTRMHHLAVGSLTRIYIAHCYGAVEDDKLYIYNTVYYLHYSRSSSSAPCLPRRKIRVSQTQQICNAPKTSCASHFLLWCIFRKLVSSGSRLHLHTHVSRCDCVLHNYYAVISFQLCTIKYLSVCVKRVAHGTHPGRGQNTRIHLANLVHLMVSSTQIGVAFHFGAASCQLDSSFCMSAAR